MCKRFPANDFDFHPHNDYGLATAMRWLPCSQALPHHATLSCLGERAAMSRWLRLLVLRDKLGLKVSIDETKIHDLSKMVENFSGKIKRVAANALIIGTDVFTQTSVSTPTVIKAKLYQTESSPDRFARQHSYALGKMSGKASRQKPLGSSASNCPRKISKGALKKSSRLRIKPQSRLRICRSSSPIF